MTLAVYEHESSRRRGELTDPDRSWQRVQCTAACGVSNDQLRHVGLGPPNDPSDHIVYERRVPWGEDRCDVAHPTVPEARCFHHVGHGGPHGGSIGVRDAFEW
jgi:hypothetical protein